MAITSERLRQTFSEGGAQEIYQEVKSMGDFLGFARQYAFSQVAGGLACVVDFRWLQFISSVIPAFIAWCYYPGLKKS